MSATTPLSSLADRAVADPIAPIFGTIMSRQAADSSFVSLAAGSPDNRLLPNDLLEALVQDARQADQHLGLLNYTMPQGLPSLRAHFARLLQDQGVRCTPDGLLITSGGMEAISLAAELTLNPGDVVLVESPAFPGAMSAFQRCGARVVHVDCDDDGIIPEAVVEAIALHQPKLLSVMPDFQNPSGRVMPTARRERLALIIEDTGVMAIEDGVYTQLRFAGDPLPPLQSYAPDHVLYASSVSKILAPAMRVGALVAPPAFVEHARRVKSAYNMQASGFTQAIAARFLDPGKSVLTDHLQSLRTAYADRYRVMDQALAQHFPDSAGYTWTRPSGGMFLWLEGPNSVDFTAALGRALEAGVAYIPGSLFYFDPRRGHQAARLNYASTSPDRIPEGIARLAMALLG
ncbi:PLP-dependent aminotransferase family protein [Micromonospora sp. B11E3]|uniref:aminotransferase-like domain-containing protein n=1 Tax=Micromonospora sp. B11E3 TaxID=3153562 RepID=UPI00325E9520